MTKYEIMYIINPTILEEGRDAVIAKVDAILTEAGATVAKTEKWGERKLAYPIEKKKRRLKKEGRAECSKVEEIREFITNEMGHLETAVECCG